MSKFRFVGTIVFIASLLAVTLTGYSMDYDYVFGDANGNGAVNVIDVQCLINSALSDIQGKDYPECLSAGIERVDVDCSGSISVVDVTSAIYLSLDKPLDVQIDSDQNGFPDCLDFQCEEYGYGYNNRFGYGYGYSLAGLEEYPLYCPLVEESRGRV